MMTVQQACSNIMESEEQLMEDLHTLIQVCRLCVCVRVRVRVRVCVCVCVCTLLVHSDYNLN